MTSAKGAPLVKVPIAFPPDMYDWLREAAFRRRVPMAVIVREALIEYRERTDPQLTLPLTVSPTGAGSGRPSE